MIMKTVCGCTSAIVLLIQRGLSVSVCCYHTTFSPLWYLLKVVVVAPLQPIISSGFLERLHVLFSINYIW